MKYLALFLVLFLAFFAIPAFIPSEEARVEAKDAGFSDEEIDRGQEYLLQRQLLSWPATILHFALLYVLLANARKLADACSRLAYGWWLPTVLLMGVLWYLLDEAISLPFALGRLEQLRNWGLTERPVGDWLVERYLARLVFGGIDLAVLAGFYLLMRYLPRTWWIACSLATPLLAIAGTIAHPLLIAPLFNDFEPLDQSKWSDLQPKVQYLLKRAGVEASEILVMDASRQGGHTNAYFTGFGKARRVVLYDTLLKDHSTAEIESILGHELGHWLHDDIVKGICLGSAGALLGFLLLYQFLGWMRGRAPCYLQGAADPAGLPLILLLGMLTSWATMPAQNVFSRYIEREADAAALELAGQPEAFISAERRMAIKNISNLTPNAWTVFLYYSHPPVLDRIRMAQEWKDAHP